MTNNKEEIDKSELFEFIESISKYIEIKINMYALGGTALTLLNIKKSTKDIDINIETYKEYKYISRIFEDLGFESKGIRWITQEGIAFDMFYGSNIMGTELLEDCSKISTLIKTIGNVNIYALNLEDIIISKLARGDPRDFEDIKTIFLDENIDIQHLIKRYKDTMQQSTVGKYKQKLLDLIDFKFKEWDFKIDKKIISEVKKWEQQ